MDDAHLHPISSTPAQSKKSNLATTLYPYKYWLRKVTKANPFFKSTMAVKSKRIWLSSQLCQLHIALKRRTKMSQTVLQSVNILTWTWVNAGAVHNAILRADLSLLKSLGRCTQLTVWISSEPGSFPFLHPECSAWTHRVGQSHGLGSQASKKGGNSHGYCTPVYAVGGRQLCWHVFCAIVELNNIVFNRHGAYFSVQTPKVYETGSGKYRKGALSVQASTVMLYLKRYDELNSLSCPTGRGSAYHLPISWLSSGTTREQAYKSYLQDWQSIIESVVDKSPSNPQVPSKPLAKDQFSRVWSAKLPFFRIHKLEVVIVTVALN